MISVKQRKHVLVIGCQRTGTNLTGLILGTHPHAILIEESDGAYEYLANDAVDCERRASKTLAKARRKYLSPRNRFKGRDQLDPAITHLVFQVPNSTYDCEALAKKFPDLRLVFPSRDVRDVVCSMANLSQVPMVENQLRFMQQREHIAEAFKEEIDCLVAPKTPMHVKRAIVWKVKTSLLFPLLEEPFGACWIRYEELVASPEPACAKILAAAGLSKHDHQLTRNTLHETYQGIGMGGTDRTWQIRKSSLGRWRERLTATEEEDIWDCTAALMQRLGYER